MWTRAELSSEADIAEASEAADEAHEDVYHPLVKAYYAIRARSNAAARLRVARTIGWPVATLVKLPSDAQVSSAASAIEILAIDAVKFVESVSEDRFLALAKSVSSKSLGAALAAIRPRDR